MCTTTELAECRIARSARAPFPEPVEFVAPPGVENRTSSTRTRSRESLAPLSRLRPYERSAVCLSPPISVDGQARSASMPRTEPFRSRFSLCLPIGSRAAAPFSRALAGGTERLLGRRQNALKGNRTCWPERRGSALTRLRHYQSPRRTKWHWQRRVRFERARTRGTSPPPPGRFLPPLLRLPHSRLRPAGRVLVTVCDDARPHTLVESQCECDSRSDLRLLYNTDRATYAKWEPACADR